jgi:hypothetical protein
MLFFGGLSFGEDVGLYFLNVGVERNFFQHFWLRWDNSIFKVTIQTRPTNLRPILHFSNEFWWILITFKININNLFINLIDFHYLLFFHWLLIIQFLLHTFLLTWIYFFNIQIHFSNKFIPLVTLFIWLASDEIACSES